MPQLILASSSRYRRELLARLGLPFESRSPDVDESAREGEKPAELALRLARDKARAVAQSAPGCWVIGSDQVMECGGRIYGKPGTHANALAQLRALSGNTARFHTALCLQQPDGQQSTAVDTTETDYRVLTDPQIERYLAAEPAYDCAGSCKAEGLGIALCGAIRSEDPTALIGLPLIALTRLLREAGWELP